VGSLAFGAFIYKEYLQPESNAHAIEGMESSSDEEMSTRSKYLYMADWLNAYCIQLLMLYVPYRWYYSG
jgi:hypothetical protein